METQGMLVFSFPSSAFCRDWNVTLRLYLVMVRESTEEPVVQTLKESFV